LHIVVIEKPAFVRKAIHVGRNHVARSVGFQLRAQVVDCDEKDIGPLPVWLGGESIESFWVGAVGRTHSNLLLAIAERVFCDHIQFAFAP